jgi:tetratricopeptide (TPR) repeat protein
VTQSIMSVSRTQLLSRKRDIIAALRLLQQDHRDGLIDDSSYASAAHRYEHEAAEILEQLDAMPAEDDASEARLRAPVITWSPRVALAGGTLVLGASAPAPSSPQLRAAERALQKHPRSVTALLNLGNAYVQMGDSKDADSVYRRAMAVAPSDPEPKVLHAMMLGSSGHDVQGLALIEAVEKSHPTYARAWLLDGMLSTHLLGGNAHAVVAWERFLKLAPHAPIAGTVHTWIAAARKAVRAHPRATIGTPAP